MSKTDCKRLGDYIRKVDVRNRDLKVKKLYGVNLQKEFMPSVANIIGTDMSKYKILSYNQFGCKLMSVERDYKMPISLMKEHEPALMSSAYFVFEVIDENVLNPDYLFMQIKRPEFDRQLWFSTGGDVRGGATWDNLCDMPILVPPIEQQRKIVAEYETISKKIRLNKRMITRLEEIAQTIYRKMFVDGIDKDNLPEGWRIDKLGNYVELSQGIQVEVNKQSPTKLKGYNRFIRIIDYTPNSSEPPRYVNIENKRYFCTVNDIVIIRYGDAGTICRRLEGIIANNLFKVTPIRKLTRNYLYYFLKSEQIQRQIKNSATSSTMPAITHSAIKDIDCIIPLSDIIKLFDNKVNVIEDKILLFQNEICKLSKLQSLFLAKMGQ